jgi:hypothetical protein
MIKIQEKTEPKKQKYTAMLCALKKMLSPSSTEIKSKSQKY